MAPLSPIDTSLLQDIHSRLMNIPSLTGLAHPDKFDMEVYGKDFIPDPDDSKFYNCVAIE